jgi:hypothetical protein
MAGIVGTVFGVVLARGWNGACERERRALGASLEVGVSGAGWRQDGKSGSNEARPRRAEQFAAGELQMGDSERAGLSTPSPSNLTRRARRRPARFRQETKKPPEGG